MASPLASTSRALLRARPPLPSLRFLSASTARCSEPSGEAPLPPPPPPSAAPRAARAAPTFLPGASLPEAYRASTVPSTPRPRTSDPRAQAHRQHANETPYQLHVFSTRNNTILTLSTVGTLGTPLEQDQRAAPPASGVVAWVSAGAAGYKGASRGTYDAAVEVALRMFQKIKDIKDPPLGVGGVRKKVAFPPPSTIELVFRGFGQGRDAVFRTLSGGEGDAVRGMVKRVTDATPIKVGGTRPKKRRVI